MSDSTTTDARTGYLFGLVAYVWWGLIPLYFRQVLQVPPGEILAHRIVWSIVVLGLLATLTGSWSRVLAVFRNRRLLFTLSMSAGLLAVNWLLYIYATLHAKVAEASLGYFMLPLVNTFLGTAFLHEKLRPAHYPALVLIAASVTIPAAAVGYVPWLAVALAVSFGLYGLVRKMAPVDSATGLMAESLLMLVPSLGYLLWLAGHGTGRMGTDLVESGWLIVSGVVTVVPLVTFAIAVKKLPLVALTFIQFISPTLQLLLAVWVFGEPRQWYDWAAGGCVWAAVAIFLLDAVLKPKVLPPRADPRSDTPADRLEAHPSFKRA